MHTATPEEKQMLVDFLLRSQKTDCKDAESIRPNPEVTALMYFFWDRSAAVEKWPLFEGASKETWRNCGFLKTVDVVNKRHDVVLDFSAKHSNVEVQLEPSLVPGNINSMSIDCNSKLAQRFHSKFVLIVQDDGFPLRPGLDEFVARGYDFIGSPYCRPNAIPNILTKILDYCPSNGGFSLRSKKICELAAECWRRHYEGRPFVVDEMSEDLFYTKTLPLHHPFFWLRRKQAPSIIAERFSFEGAFELSSKDLPFGFHTASGFAHLSKRFNIRA